MTYEEITKIVKEHGGTIQGGINWTWAVFDSDEEGKKAFAVIEPHVDHRGYYDAQPKSSNENLHKGGFRFR